MAAAPIEQAPTDLKAQCLALTPDARVARFIVLTDAKRKIESKLASIAEELDVLKGIIADDFISNGQQSVTRNGVTVYLSRDISIKSKTGSTGDIVEHLRRARLGDLIGVNWPGIKAWAKERMYDSVSDTWEVRPDRLPPTIAEIVDIAELNSVRCRKA